MRKALLIAALMMTTSIGIAHAGDSWSFQVNGQKVRIERPRNCTSLSCINIVAPGLNSSSSDDEPASNATTSNPPPQTNQPVAAAPMQQPVQQVQQPVQQVQQPMQQQQVATAPAMSAPVAAPVATVPPLPGQADASSNVTTLPAPNTVTPPALPQVAQPVQQPVQQYQQPVQQVQQPMPQQQVATVQPTAPAQTVVPAAGRRQRPDRRVDDREERGQGSRRELRRRHLRLRGREERR